MCNKEDLICLGDGDNIGDVIDFYLLSNELEKASKFSCEVKAAIKKIAELAKKQMNANIIYFAGDDICFIVSMKNQDNIFEKLTEYSDSFVQMTGQTISFGVGKTSVEASVCLRKAKVSGKSRIIISEV